ncbi:PREDICTED: uncharacterized protein LOC109582637 [Amphimedon queenslandica]|uniref:Death domain-containing protein n=1 Tax=Amphimedon queenslandica TaxID=400682 RepID=A0AAN0J7N0_AMPQE|nr:PREDICTED: uncharacterized protein LOC109582637 [Amphimedon queenslandica]|eukprot:XP_019853035.1 PREDICTED: uncharacterized protein LOC109582637 [Amphimedon queenslandica]
MEFIFSPSTGVTVMTHCLQSLALFISTIGSSFDLIYYLVLLLLLLSGDVELNPGPMIDDQPSCLLLAKCLKPLADWKPFALCLPGITQSDVSIINKTKRNAHLKKMALHKKWLQVNPTASWRDVINALKQCKENELARTIEHEMEWSTGGANNDGNTSTNPTGKNSDDNMEAMTRSNPGQITGNPMDILRTHSHLLTDGISCDLYRITSELLAKGLIPQQTFDDVLVMGIMTDYTKAMKLMSVLQRQLESSLTPEQYLINTCHVLMNQQHHTLTDIATSILHQLGQSIPDNVSSHTVLPSQVDDTSNTSVTNIRGQSDVTKPIHSIPDDVQGYADNMRQLYNLHTLALPLATAESAVELFTILQTNNTLKALSIDIKEISWEWEEEEGEEELEVEEGEEEGEEGEEENVEERDSKEYVGEEEEEEEMEDWEGEVEEVDEEGEEEVEEEKEAFQEEEEELELEEEDKVYTRSMGTSLQNMLTQNYALKHLEINDDISSDIPSSFLSFLTTGLRHNNSLQQLSIPIPALKEIQTFIDVISQKNNLTELKMNLKLDQSCGNCSDEKEEEATAITPFFYELLLPAVSTMLTSHATIKLLRIEYDNSDDNLSQSNWIDKFSNYDTANYDQVCFWKL